MNIVVPNWKLNLLIPYGYITPDVRPSIKPWWRHQMKTFSALPAICAGNSPGNKVQWRGALIFSLIGVWINGWVNNREAGDLRRYRAHHDFIGNCNARLIIIYVCQCFCIQLGTNINSRNLDCFRQSWLLWYLPPDADRGNIFMMTSSNGNILRVTGHLCGEFTGPRWIPRTKASDAALWCFL